MKLSFLLPCIFFAQFIFAQTIKGTITDKSGVVPFSLIVVSENDHVLQYAHADKNGFYELQLQKRSDALTIQANSIGHLPGKILLAPLLKQGENEIVVDIFIEEGISTLQEVVIQKQTPIIHKKDTVTYNPEFFKDGTERVIEDLLKKLPGISVTESGEIKYKGKSIKKMLLDGDDLFDKKYTVGSRNIDIRMLDKVQAIEHYNDNPLLKNLKDTEDVALNLQLKKGQSDLSGNLYAALGYRQKADLKAAAILLNPKTKSFGVSNFNNTGTNNAPYDFQSGIISAEDISDADFRAKELIGWGNFYSPLEDKFKRINNSIFQSLSSLFKLSRQLKARINVSFYGDQLSMRRTAKTDFYTPSDTIISTQKEDISKAPKVYAAEFQLLKSEGKKVNWEYLGKHTQTDIRFLDHAFNDGVAQQGRLTGKNIFAKHSFTLTWRLDETRAFTADADFAYNEAPQDYFLFPGLNPESNTTLILKTQQKSRFSKQTSNAKFQYLSKFGSFKWSVRGGYQYTANRFGSDLTVFLADGSTDAEPAYQNNMHYEIAAPFLDGILSYSGKKFAFRAAVGGKYLSLSLKEEALESDKSEKSLRATTDCKVVYKFTRKTNLSFSYSLNQEAPSETNLFKGYVQTGYRYFQNNEPALQYSQNQTFALTFSYNDYFNLTNFSLTLNHQQRDKNYYSRADISQNTNKYTFFLLDSGNRDYALDLSAEKYMGWLKTTFLLNASYALAYDKSIVNNSELRDFESRNLTVSLIARTGGKSPFFIENKLSFLSNAFWLTSNHIAFKSFSDSFKVVYKIADRFKYVNTLTYLQPDMDMGKSYFFWESEVNYSLSNKKIEFALIGRNLTNHQNFTTRNISDYSATASSHQLLERFFLASVAFNF